MAVCEICGCKTNELDFVESSVGGVDKKVCSFCHKQLKGFGTAKLTPAQTRWLKAVAEKDVPERAIEINRALNRILNTQGDFTEGEEFSSFGVPGAAAQVKQSADDRDRVIFELTKRVEELENTIVSMKRAQMIKTIIEITVPVILGIILLIVFFASGLYDSLSSIYNMFI